MATGKELLAIAAREIGYREDKNKHNKFGEWYGLDYQPWCMEFVQWCYAQAGMTLPYKTASCGVLLNWYRANDPLCIVKEPVEGCIVIFDFPGGAATDHTGLFVRLDRAAGTITTIDGNTSGTNQSNGGWVHQKTRKLTYANPKYIVPRALAKEEPMERQEPEVQKMEKRYNTLDEIRSELPWATNTVEKLIRKGILKGSDSGLDLSRDMVRMFVFNARAGLYD